MGEVYRADDLRLGQAVALKFLPEALADDAGRLRPALQRGAHGPPDRPSRGVPRLRHRRGGRTALPLAWSSWTARTSRRSCAASAACPRTRPSRSRARSAPASAAAHERGVLHRDLKPDNVMLDGRGKARITDFGLAGLATNIQGDDIRSGTPAYMSPEQLAGREVTDGQRRLRARSRAVRGLHREEALRGPHARGDHATAQRGHPREPFADRGRDRPRGRARDPALPGAGSAATAALRARRRRRPARRRPAGRRAGRGRDAVAGAGGGLGCARRCCPPTVAWALLAAAVLAVAVALPRRAPDPDRRLRPARQAAAGARRPRARGARRAGVRRTVAADSALGFAHRLATTCDSSSHG